MRRKRTGAASPRPATSQHLDAGEKPSWSAKPQRLRRHEHPGPHTLTRLTVRRGTCETCLVSLLWRRPRPFFHKQHNTGTSRQGSYKSEILACLTAGALDALACDPAAPEAAAAVMLRVCTERPAKKGNQTLSGCRAPPGAEGSRARVLSAIGFGSAPRCGGAGTGAAAAAAPAAAT